VKTITDPKWCFCLLFGHFRKTRGRAAHHQGYDFSDVSSLASLEKHGWARGPVYDKCLQELPMSIWVSPKLS